MTVTDDFAQRERDLGACNNTETDSVINPAIHERLDDCDTTQQMSCLFCTTVNSLCKDAGYKDNFDVRTAPLVTNQCILTAVVPLSTDNLIKGQTFW